MSDETKLLAFPITEKISYREKIDDEKLNTMINSLQESVLRAVLRSNEIVEQINTLNLAVNSSYTSLNSASDLLMNYPGSGLFCSSYGSVEMPDGGNQNKIAGITTLNWDKNKKLSKIPRYDNDGDGIPDTLSPNVTILVDGVERTKDDAVYNTLIKRNDKLWVEETTAPGTHTIEIQFPASINKRFNYLEIVPFPVFGISIDNISYQTPQGKTENIVPAEEYDFYNNKGPLVFHLQPKEYSNAITITYTTDQAVMGFSNIDVGLIDYNNTPKTFYYKFENLDPSLSEIIVDRLQLDFYVDGNSSNYSNYLSEVSLVKTPTSTTVERTFSPAAVIPAVGKPTMAHIITGLSGDLYLKVVMKEFNMTTPVFRGCKLIYST